MGLEGGGRGGGGTLASLALLWFYLVAALDEGTLGRLRGSHGGAMGEPWGSLQGGHGGTWSGWLASEHEFARDRQR